MRYGRPLFSLGAAIFTLATVLNADLFACSTFVLDKNSPVVGRTYDWDYGLGLVIVNKRNQNKTALTYYEESRTGLAEWKSKYGSVTFNQYGRDIPISGMNEAGLVVSNLWLDQSVYPSADGRPSVSVDQYIQYLLDNFQTIGDIIASDTDVRVRPIPSGFTKIHFFAADASGDAAVIEFLNGRMVFHAFSSLPVKAITNNTYDDSLKYFNRGIPPLESDRSSLARFYHAARLSSAYEGTEPAVDYAFKVIDAVRQDGTKFQMVFDIRNRRVYYKSKKNPELRYFRMDGFDFSCSTPSTMLSINAAGVGDVTDEFIEYSTLTNEEFIIRAWVDLGHTNVPQQAVESISRYPETFVCAGGSVQTPSIYSAVNKGSRKLIVEGANLDRRPRVFVRVGDGEESEITAAARSISATRLVFKGNLQLMPGLNVAVRVDTEKGTASFAFTAK